MSIKFKKSLLASLIVPLMLVFACGNQQKAEVAEVKVDKPVKRIGLW